jgi:uncharacterized membrane protein YfcA
MIDLGPWVLAELVALGVIVGFLAGLLGIGGGMIMVPFLNHILLIRGVPADVAVKMAIATAMATIVFTSLSSVRAHHGRGTVRWDVVRRLAPAIMVGGLIASLGVFALIKGRVLAGLFGMFIGYTAWRMLRQADAPAGGRLPGPVGQWSAGGAIGFLSGLVGAGGAFVSVPVMSRWGIGMREVVGTAAALGFPIAVANGVGYVLGGWSVPDRPAGSLGYVWLPALAIIAAGSVLTAPRGAAAAHRWPIARLRRLFAALLAALGLYMVAVALRG